MPWEVGALTPWQAKNLYFCEREEDGQVRVGFGDLGDMKNPMERFVEEWVQKGLTAKQAMDLWEERDGPVIDKPEVHHPKTKEELMTMAGKLGIKADYEM